LGSIIRFKRRLTDQERFDALVRPHFDALYRSAVRLTNTEQDAEDLLQDVVLKALAWLDDLEKVECPKAWLIKGMYNTFIDMTRKDGRSPTSLSHPADYDPDQMPAPDDSLALLFDRHRRVDQVIKAMRFLNPEDCALIGMCDVEGLTINELKQVTGLAEGTIKSRLHRARKKLGRLLSSEVAEKPKLRVVGGTS
jgi:RNA polymerase sigma-70 factor (ECF subfamily)